MDPMLAPAQPSDIPWLLPMIEAFYAIDGYPFDPDATRRAVSDLLAEPALGGIWLVVIDDVTAGYAVVTLGYSLEFHGRDAFVDELYLHVEWRGRGIGTAVIDALVAECAACGVKAVHLEVETQNTPAQQLYRRAGFKDNNRHLWTRWIDAEG